MWLTCEGDVKDHVLRQGDTPHLTSAGHVMVQALSASRFCLAQRASRVRAVHTAGPGIRGPCPVGSTRPPERPRCHERRRRPPPLRARAAPGCAGVDQRQRMNWPTVRPQFGQTPAAIEYLA
nr:DUF2917 domain-containing protein [Myxococcus xanthus]